MDVKPIHRIAVRQVEPERATEYVGQTGIKFDLVIGKHNEDASYWTKNSFEVAQDGYDWKAGDKVVMNYQVVAEAFGTYADKRGYDLGLEKDGEKLYFFKPEDVWLTIRDGVIIAPRGKCVVTQVAKAPVTSLFVIPDQAKKEYEDDIYKVVAVGEPTPENKLNLDANRMTLKVLTEAIPEVGDVVVVQKHRGYPIKAPLNNELGEHYWLIEMHEIMGTIN